MTTDSDIRGILFDLDGTLVDTIGLILSSYRHTMSTHLDQIPPDESWLMTLGQPLRVQLQKFARSPDELEAMFQTYLEHNEANHQQLVRPFPGMLDAVRSLGAAGYRLAVVTSKIRPNTDRELATVGLAEYFDVTVTADDVQAPKPDPEPVHTATRQLDLTEREVLMVGDSVFDLRAGRAAGVRTAAALWGPFGRSLLMAEKPDFWLEGVASLLSLLGVGSRPGDG